MNRSNPANWLLRSILILCATILPLAATASAQDGALKFADLGSCKLDNGEQIENCRVGYRAWGKLNEAGTNAVLFPTWFTGTSEQIGGNVGPDKLVDPSRYFVIAIDAFGNGVSSSPSNSGAQPRMQFPAFTTRDMVRAEYRLATETLGLKHVHAVMGISMGGMQTFEWMVDYPEFMDVAIPIVGSTRLTSYDLLLWHGEEDAIRTNPAWQEGNYTNHPTFPQMEILHDMNLTTPSHYAREVTLADFNARYAGYSRYENDTMDPDDRIYQLEAMIHHDVSHGGSLEDAAQRVRAKVLVVASEQDHMINPAPALAFAKLLGAKTFLLTSDCGHLAPGCEAKKLNPAVRAFLDSH